MGFQRYWAALLSLVILPVTQKYCLPRQKVLRTLSRGTRLLPRAKYETTTTTPSYRLLYYTEAGGGRGVGPTRGRVLR